MLRLNLLLFLGWSPTRGTERKLPKESGREVEGECVKFMRLYHATICLIYKQTLGSAGVESLHIWHQQRRHNSMRVRLAAALFAAHFHRKMCERMCDVRIDFAQQIILILGRIILLMLWPKRNVMVKCSSLFSHWLLMVNFQFHVTAVSLHLFFGPIRCLF